MKKQREISRKFSVSCLSSVPADLLHFLKPLFYSIDLLCHFRPFLHGGAIVRTEELVSSSSGNFFCYCLVMKTLLAFYSKITVIMTDVGRTGGSLVPAYLNPE